jgi:hypothetical protein
VLLTELNVPLMLLESALTTETRAMQINPIKTAYSTAVGPSSLTRKRKTDRMARDIVKFSCARRELGVELVTPLFRT